MCHLPSPKTRECVIGLQGIQFLQRKIYRLFFFFLNYLRALVVLTKITEHCILNNCDQFWETVPKRADKIFSDLLIKSLAILLTFHMAHHSTLYSQRFRRYSTPKCSYFENELSRKTKNNKLSGACVILSQRSFHC